MKEKLEKAKKHLYTAYGILHGLPEIVASQTNAEYRLRESIFWLRDSINTLFPAARKVDQVEEPS